MLSEKFKVGLLKKYIFHYLLILTYVYIFINGLQASDKGSRQMLIGTMLHDIFQKATTRGFGGDILQKLALQSAHVPKYLKEM